MTFGLGSSEPASLTDPGGCVWLIYSPPNRRDCLAESQDGCETNGTCDRPPDDSTDSTDPGGGSSFKYGTVGEIPSICADKVTGLNCSGCASRFWDKFNEGCPSLCANAVRMPSSNQCPTGTTPSFLNPGWCCPVPTPTPTPTRTPTPTPTPEECVYEQAERPWDPSGYGELDCLLCQDGYDNDCWWGIDGGDYKCFDCYSPIVIDTLGNGFDLTGASEGVDFDIAGVGTPIRISWTHGDDTWLALDRNGNGTIDSGKELFGTVTYQASSAQRNGFLALAVYDMPNNGGNSDGLIDWRDSIFASLRLWLDTNHNGISEQNELHELPSLDVRSLDLGYRESRRVDAHGNRFRYRARVRGEQGSDLGRWAWDVFLVPDSQTGRRTVTPRIVEFVLEQSIFGFERPECRGRLSKVL